MDDNKLYMWIWACITIIITIIVASITYYNTISPSATEISIKYKIQKLKYQETLVKTYNVSPAVLECLERRWDKVSVYQICKSVLSNNNLTKQEAQGMVDKMKELER